MVLWLCLRSLSTFLTLQILLKRPERILLEAGNFHMTHGCLGGRVPPNGGRLPHLGEVFAYLGGGFPQIGEGTPI